MLILELCNISLPVAQQPMGSFDPPVPIDTGHPASSPPRVLHTSALPEDTNSPFLPDAVWPKASFSR